MSFPLVHHLPRLVALVEKFYMCDRKVSNLISYFSYFIVIFLINDQGKQHRMLKKRPVAMEWLQAICVINFSMCKRKVQFFLHKNII